MVTKVDKRRLNDGAKALSLPPLDKSSKEDLENRLSQLHDAIAAMQSLDDLGSEEENEQAWQDMLKLEREYKRVKAMLDNI